MLLNSYIIRDYSKIPLKGSLSSDPLNLTLKQPSLWTEGKKIDTEKIYLLKEEQMIYLPDTLCDCTLLISGVPSEDLLSKDCDILFTQEKISIEFLLDTITDIFWEFRELELQLSSSATKTDSLQFICDTILPYLRNPLCISTTFFQTICFAEKKKNKSEYHFTKDKCFRYPSDDAVDELTLHPEFLPSLKYTDPMIFPADLAGFRFLYQNIRNEGRNVGRLLICEIDSPIQQSDFPIVALACKYIESGFNDQNKYYFLNHPPQLADTVHSLIERKDVSSHELEKAIRSYNWHITDEYICYCISSSRDMEMGTFYNTCIRLENKVSYSLATEINGSILYLVNLTISGLTRQKVNEIIVYVLREGILKAGISTEFNNLSDLRQYYTQAEVALSIGNKCDPDIWSYYFENYALNYITDTILHSMSSWCLCHRGLKVLIEYDKKKKRNYSKTLRVYLENNMSVVKTINILYLQRQTFLYQLKRIKEISNLDLDDYQTRLYLQLSFRLLDADGKL